MWQLQMLNTSICQSFACIQALTTSSQILSKKLVRIGSQQSVKQDLCCRMGCQGHLASSCDIAWIPDSKDLENPIPAPEQTSLAPHDPWWQLHTRLSGGLTWGPGPFSMWPSVTQGGTSIQFDRRGNALIEICCSYSMCKWSLPQYQCYENNACQSSDTHK